MFFANLNITLQVSFAKLPNGFHTSLSLDKKLNKNNSYNLWNYSCFFWIMLVL